MISEKITLLGKGLYESIPDVLTLKSIPTASELDYVGSEDFDRVMLETILPSAIEEDIDCYSLLELDYQWICRCLRILNYGPYYTTNAIYCTDCGKVSYGEYQVNLNTVDCYPLPEGFINDIMIRKEEFIDFNGEIRLKLPTIKQILTAYKDKAFKINDDKANNELAKICYMITSIKGKSNLNPVEIKLIIQNELSSADYILLKDKVTELTNYGLRAGGTAQCPKCRSLEASFIALTDDRFFRPTVGDLRKWRDDRNSGKAKDIPGIKTAAV
ncbi:MAG: hypothetical protein NC320_03315 [Clostridium sp.]|nr:hypothetical protein [Clostridium sp.]